jgi:hypothetical protein
MTTRLGWASALPQRTAPMAHVEHTLLLTGLSYNVGGVKYFSSILLHALGEERHFALVEKVPCPTKARSQSEFRSELGPTHASLRSQRKLYFSPSDRSGMIGRLVKTHSATRVVGRESNGHVRGRGEGAGPPRRVRHRFSGSGKYIA